MDFISSDLKKPGATNTFVHVSTQSPASTVYRLKSASTIVSGSHELTNSEEAFSDLLEEKMWEAYKEIEPRYSNANRKLAQ